MLCLQIPFSSPECFYKVSPGCLLAEVVCPVPAHGTGPIERDAAEVVISQVEPS